jgi:hypothetical protein
MTAELPDPQKALAVHKTVTENREQVQQLLSDLLITISDKVFQNQTIYIDGYRFINCRFENCHLYVRRGTFAFHHCAIYGGLNLYSDNAQNVIQLFTKNHPGMENDSQLNQLLYPTIHPDGTYSIPRVS